MSWAPSEAIVNLARQIAANKASTLLSHGMGPNHFFNADLKDRALFLIAALTKNIGHFGGSPGSYAGNYRVALFNGLPQYVTEDPFNTELDPTNPHTYEAIIVNEWRWTMSCEYADVVFGHVRLGDKPVCAGLPAYALAQNL